MSETGLLNPASIRRIADQIGLRPTKTRGQNFVHDANTVRRIVSLSQVEVVEQILRLMVQVVKLLIMYLILVLTKTIFIHCMLHHYMGLTHNVITSKKKLTF